MDPVAAWDAPETRRSYATYRLGGLRWFALGLVGIALGIGLSAYAVLILKRPGLGVFIVASLILGLIGLGTGVGALFRARRFRLALQRAPWSPAELRVVGAHLRLVFPGDSATSDNATSDSATSDSATSDSDAWDGDRGRTVDVRLLTTSRWRVRAVVGLQHRLVDVCPRKDGSFVLTAPGLDNLYGLRPLTRRRARQRP